MVAKSRGVVLVYVLILTMLMVWIGAMFLSAMLSRKVVARNAMSSNEVHGVMSAASSLIMSCLASNNPPWPGTATPSCTASPSAGGPPNTTTINTCMGLGTPPVIGGRQFAYCIGSGPGGSANPFPCRIRINVCAQGDTCPTPICP